jgi:Leucine-rich repeat (LRR) protein
MSQSDEKVIHDLIRSLPDIYHGLLSYFNDVSLQDINGYYSKFKTYDEYEDNIFSFDDISQTDKLSLALFLRKHLIPLAKRTTEEREGNQQNSDDVALKNVASVCEELTTKGSWDGADQHDGTEMKKIDVDSDPETAELVTEVDSLIKEVDAAIITPNDIDKLGDPALQEFIETHKEKYGNLKSYFGDLSMDDLIDTFKLYESADSLEMFPTIMSSMAQDDAAMNTLEEFTKNHLMPHLEKECGMTPSNMQIVPLHTAQDDIVTTTGDTNAFDNYDMENDADWSHFMEMRHSMNKQQDEERGFPPELRNIVIENGKLNLRGKLKAVKFEEVKKFLEIREDNTDIKKLDLRKNNISSIKLRGLFDIIELLPNLKIIDLSHNSITEWDNTTAVLNKLCIKRNIRWVIVRHNFITDPVFPSRSLNKLDRGGLFKLVWISKKGIYDGEWDNIFDDNSVKKIIRKTHTVYNREIMKS